MVQFYRGSPSPKDAAWGQLATALGKNLGHGITTYQANQTLQDLLKDPAFKDAPISAKMGELQTRMSRYGDVGKEVIQNQMMVEMEEQQEKQKKLDLKKGNVLRRRLNGEEITEAEKDLFSPQEEMAIAKHEQAIQLQNLKNQQQPKATQASQPINPDQLKRIQDVRKKPEYETASPSKKYQMLTDNQVSKENAKAEADIYAEEEKNKPGGEFAKSREKAVSDLVNTSFEKRKDAEELKFTFDSARKAINGEIEGPGVMAVLKNDPYGQLLIGLTPDESSLQATNKKMLEGTKGIFGSKPTEREIFLLLNGMLPSVGKTKEANLAGLNVVEKANDLVIMRADIIDDLTDQGTKYVPDLESQLNKRMKPIVDDFRNELREVKKALDATDQSKPKQKIKVRAPDGTIGYMTQDRIDKAKAKNVIFKPV
jgi:hypothetical protein